MSPIGLPWCQQEQMGWLPKSLLLLLLLLYNPMFLQAMHSACYMLHIDLLLGLFFKHEDEGNIFLQNAD
jgi:hypothetical protein